MMGDVFLNYYGGSTNNLQLHTHPVAVPSSTQFASTPSSYATRSIQLSEGARTPLLSSHYNISIL